MHTTTSANVQHYSGAWQHCKCHLSPNHSHRPWPLPRQSADRAAPLKINFNLLLHNRKWSVSTQPQKCLYWPARHREVNEQEATPSTRVCKISWPKVEFFFKRWTAPMSDFWKYDWETHIFLPSLSSGLFSESSVSPFCILQWITVIRLLQKTNATNVTSIDGQSSTANVLE